MVICRLLPVCFPESFLRLRGRVRDGLAPALLNGGQLIRQLIDQLMTQFAESLRVVGLLKYVFLHAC